MTTVGAAAPSASASASGGNDVKAPEQREEGNEVEEREAAELGGNSSSSLKSVLESSETLKPSHVEVVDVSGTSFRRYFDAILAQSPPLSLSFLFFSSSFGLPLSHLLFRPHFIPKTPSVNKSNS